MIIIRHTLGKLVNSFQWMKMPAEVETIIALVSPIIQLVFNSDLILMAIDDFRCSIREAAESLFDL